MGPLFLLSMMGLGLMAVTLSGDDSVAPSDPDEEIEIEGDDVPPDVTPDEPLDVGASFAFDPENNAVTIDVGEDETGSLAVFTYTDSEDSEDNFYETHEARYYLVPEGVDFSSASYETQYDVPGADGYQGGEYNLAAMEEQLGLEFLGSVDLLGSQDGVQVFEELPALTADQPVASYLLEANTDGDDLVSFLPEDFVVTYNGVPATDVTADAGGTDGTDWLVARANGITVNGEGGGDKLDAYSDNVTLDGGAGDDVIDAYGFETTAIGGAGDDEITITSGTALGGEGVDRITSYADGAVTLDGGVGDDFVTAYGAGGTVYGREGDDNIAAHGAGSQAFGGTGDDFVGVRSGATGYGGAGDDHLQVDEGSTGIGGDGDDLIQVWNQFRNDEGAATLTGGDGADTFDIGVRNAMNGESGDIYTLITDFDPAEDILKLESNVRDVELVEAEDGSYTDVRLTYAPASGFPPGIAVIRLDGTTGITVDQVMIVR